MTAFPLADLAHDVPVLGPTGVAVSGIGTASQQVLAADPYRRGVWFHNPGSVIVRVAPASITPVTTGVGIMIYPQSDWSLLGDDLINVNSAWNAVADSAGGVLSILNFTDVQAVNQPPAPLSRLNQSITVTSPNAIAVTTLTNVSASVIGANVMRRGIIFHNPGSIVVAVSPANIPAVVGAGGIVILPGGEKRIIGNAFQGRGGRVRVNCGWNAIAQALTNNPLVISELL